MNNTIHFLLVPDRTSARYLRRVVCENGGGLGVQVGTWPELLQAALDACLLAPSQTDWHQNLADALKTREGFWAKSFQVAPEETTAAVARELSRLLRSIPPGQSLDTIPTCSLTERARKHLTDLVALAASIGLPAELESIQALLDVPAGQLLRTIVVYRLPDFPALDPWQQALIDRLHAGGGVQPMPSWQTLLEKHLPIPACGNNGALRFLQDNLFAENLQRTELDTSLQWIGVRDYLEEAEVVAGMIQQAMESGDRSFADFAIVLPENPIYDVALKQVFRQAGIPCSGLRRREAKRDLAGEAVFEFLLTMHKPAPVMALASLLTSPLMPWDRRTGFDLADQIMSGNFDMDRVSLPTEPARKMRTLLTQKAERCDQLRQALSTFAELLTAPDGQEDLLASARVQIAAICDQLQTGETIDWPGLLATAGPARLQVETAEELTREGVAVFYENLEPWRRVDTLFVLGFCAGHYPTAAPGSPVFSEEDILALKKTGCSLESASEQNARLRAIFARQLKAAATGIHFLVPRRTATGEAQTPSASLSFMASLFTGIDSPEELILDLDAEQERQRLRGLALVEPAVPEPPRPLDIGHLELKRNLLEILKSKDGTPYPLSPSSIETLMTSPLAWVLGRAGLEPRDWSPEELDVMSKGTLAHAVFEGLFAPGKDLPDAATIRTAIPSLLAQSVSRIAPFLQRPEWKVERNHLQKEIEEAALSWRLMLEKMGARPLGVEVWLRGQLDSQPIHGSADCLLQLPDGRILVVDYKKSKSKSRRERMQAGYDSQASLYRIMLKTGSGEFLSSDGTKVTIEPDAEIGVLYYLMNDQTALADTDHWLDPSPPGLEELGADVSVEAMKLIRQRLVEVKQGRVLLNTESDAAWFETNAGITLYALKDNPLVKLFLLPAEEVHP